jgi:hypothetical protein
VRLLEFTGPMATPSWLVLANGDAIERIVSTLPVLIADAVREVPAASASH